MAYATGNPKTKKELKEWVSAFQEWKRGPIEAYNPSGMFPDPKDGVAYIEGPHFPKPHKWYAQVEVKNGIIIKVIK